ncbi:hypothetical protein F5ESL0245_02535 [Lactobacillus sp. ESL0245]|nr:hypothetical protein F5ESL0247_02535 [Lactobacillus sp. ESL0247]RMC29121.1 hypothetical protein F5ESL0246_02535 [Lactobacillus sp. ESL0246]RMC32724.1 hypothetical protein F5ESL0245_02535 [Lactobacillus sp. ESL0245]RMC49661.1 hypothetical protein F5ESL0228_02760 [Lactobacillus sp. ESL0228]
MEVKPKNFKVLTNKERATILGKLKQIIIWVMKWVMLFTKSTNIFLNHLVELCILSISKLLEI